MDKELKQVQEIFPDTYLNYNKERDVSRIYFNLPQNAFRVQSYITMNEFSKVYFLFIDGLRLFNKDLDKILNILKAIKEIEDK